MPTYDYRCPAGHDFEHFFRKISDAMGELPCPECGAVAARRVSGGAGLVFKGSGFYLTDYGKNAHRKAGSDAAASDSKSDGAAESKPAEKSETSKSEGASASTKSENASGAQSDPSKSSETKSSPKPKGGESK